MPMLADLDLGTEQGAPDPALSQNGSHAEPSGSFPGPPDGSQRGGLPHLPDPHQQGSGGQQQQPPGSGAQQGGWRLGVGQKVLYARGGVEAPVQGQVCTLAWILQCEFSQGIHRSTDMPSNCLSLRVLQPTNNAGWGSSIGTCTQLGRWLRGLVTLLITALCCRSQLRPPVQLHAADVLGVGAGCGAGAGSRKLPGGSGRHAGLSQPSRAGWGLPARTGGHGLCPRAAGAGSCRLAGQHVPLVRFQRS